MISFIIPAHNEERLLQATLESIHAAARAVRSDYEIVVVDDASTDRTAEVAGANAARLVRVDHRQISAARNSGAAAASGDLFVFVDADTVISEAVLESLLAAVDRGVVGGGASVDYDAEAPSYVRMLLPLTLFLYLRVARLAAGCFMFATRDAFESAGRFDEDLYAAEEIGFCRALKRQGRFRILRESVTTSARKFGRYSSWVLFAPLLRILIHGRAAVRSRKYLDIWYRDRRTPPAGG